jgi:hypothetical protein
MHGAMQQSEAMHFLARLTIDHLVPIIHDVKNLFNHEH